MDAADIFISPAWPMVMQATFLAVLGGELFHGGVVAQPLRSSADSSLTPSLLMTTL
jgi:hypothetical protein